MTDYRRIYTPGAGWFFTVNLLETEVSQFLFKETFVDEAIKV
jgi:hypothetical protein